MGKSTDYGVTSLEPERDTGTTTPTPQPLDLTYTHSDTELAIRKPITDYALATSSNIPLSLSIDSTPVLMDSASKDILKAAEENSISAFISVSLVAFVLYEHSLSFASEVQTLWSHGQALMSLLLFSNRYISIAYAFSAMYCAIIANTCESWLVVTIVECICYMLLTIILAFFAALRVYAIWDRNVWLFLPILGLGLIPTVTNLYYSSHLRITLSPDEGCVPLQTSSAAVSSIFGKFTRISAIIVDCSVLILTWARLSPLGTRMRLNGHSVPSILLRNGCSYFLALLLLNVAEIVVFQLTGVTYITYFIGPITSSLMSRFVMDLRSSYAATERLGMSSASRVTQSDSVLTSLVSSFGHDPSHGPISEE